MSRSRLRWDSYLEVPARCTILYAIQMPRGARGTTFANQRQAYDDLPHVTQSSDERIRHSESEVFIIAVWA